MHGRPYNQSPWVVVDARRAAHQHGCHSGHLAARLRLVVVALALTTLTSCVAREGVAVSGADQTVVLHLARCDSAELVTEVRLATAGRNKIADDSDDHVLWEAQAEGPGAPLDEIVVGVPPAGMVQTVPLVEPLRREQEYHGLIDSGVRGITYFRPDQLRADSVLYSGRLQSVVAFHKAARSGGNSPNVSNWEVVVRAAGLLAVIVVAVGLVFVVQRRRRSRGGGLRPSA